MQSGTLLWVFDFSHKGAGHFHKKKIKIELLWKLSWPLPSAIEGSFDSLNYCLFGSRLKGALPSFTNKPPWDGAADLCLPGVTAATGTKDQLACPGTLPSWLVARDELQPAGARPVCTRSGCTWHVWGTYRHSYCGANKDPPSPLAQVLGWNEAFLCSVMAFGVLPWEAVNFLKCGDPSSMAHSLAAVAVIPSIGSVR